MKYSELKEKHQKERNEFPMRFAFSNEQFFRILQEWDIKKEDVDKELLSIPGGGVIRKKDSKAFSDMFTRCDKEMTEAMMNDKFLTEALEYELGNHEYIITHDPTDTLESLGLDPEKLTEREKNCLKIAKESYLSWQYANGE